MAEKEYLNSTKDAKQMETNNKTQISNWDEIAKELRSKKKAKLRHGVHLPCQRIPNKWAVRPRGPWWVSHLGKGWSHSNGNRFPHAEVACYSKPPSPLLDQDSKTGRGLGMLYNEEKARFQNTLIVSWWYREAASRLTRSGAFLWFTKYIWLPLMNLELGAEAKIGELGSHWPSPDHSGPFAAKIVVCLPRPGAVEFGVRGLLSYIVWSLTVHIFSLSQWKLGIVDILQVWLLNRI